MRKLPSIPEHNPYHPHPFIVLSECQCQRVNHTEISLKIENEAENMCVRQPLLPPRSPCSSSPSLPVQLCLKRGGEREQAHLTDVDHF